MKVSITSYERTITFEDPNGDEYDIDEFVERVVRPIMLAIEYDQHQVDDRLGLE